MKARENLKLYPTGLGDRAQQLLRATFYASPILQNPIFEGLDSNISVSTWQATPARLHTGSQRQRGDPSSCPSDLRNDLSCKEFYPESLLTKKTTKIIFLCTLSLNPGWAQGNAFQQVWEQSHMTAGGPDLFSAVDSAVWENSCPEMRKRSRQLCVSVSFDVWKENDVCVSLQPYLLTYM